MIIYCPKIGIVQYHLFLWLVCEYCSNLISDDLIELSNAWYLKKMYFNGTPGRPISVYSTNEFLTYIPNRGHYQSNYHYEKS